MNVFAIVNYNGSSVILHPIITASLIWRKVNPNALKNVFKLFVLFLKDAELVTGETVAIDGTKVRAHNSKKNNYSQKKIDRHLDYVEEKTKEYLQQLDANDVNEDSIKVKDIQAKIESLKKNKIKYEQLQELRNFFLRVS